MKNSCNGHRPVLNALDRLRVLWIALYVRQPAHVAQRGSD